MVIARLAPSDYHRMHAPADVKILDVTSIQSSYYSVNSEAIRANDDTIYNTRKIIMLQTLSNITDPNSINANRPIAFVAIGATCVGSVLMSAEAGQVVPKGEQIAWFQFGGSTVVMLFPPNAVAYDNDLVQASSLATEIRILVRERMGVWIN